MVSPMIRRGYLFDSRRALASVRSIREAARGLAHIARATQTLFFDSRVILAWSLGNQLLIAPSAAGPRSSATVGSGARNSPVEREGGEPENRLPRHRSSTSFSTDASSPGFETLLGI